MDVPSVRNEWEWNVHVENLEYTYIQIISMIAWSTLDRKIGKDKEEGRHEDGNEKEQTSPTKHCAYGPVVIRQAFATAYSA